MINYPRPSSMVRNSRLVLFDGRMVRVNYLYIVGAGFDV